MNQPHDAAYAQVLHRAFERLGAYMNTCILGQPAFVDLLLVAVLADGHLLVEGAPGLAKTKAIKALSKAIHCDDQRIQFTPDLLPSDLTGTDMYRPEDGTFLFQPGPVFTISSSPTKSTARPPRFRLRCWKRWRSAR